jgi:hypothetical protein
MAATFAPWTGYDRAQEGTGKYLNPKFEIGNLERTSASGAEILQMEEKESLAVWSKTLAQRQILSITFSREALWPPSGAYQEQKDFSTQQKSLAVCRESDLLLENRSREAPWPPSGSHQEQALAATSTTLKRCGAKLQLRDKRKRKGRPATGRPSLFKGE